MIAGLEEVTQGRISIGGTDVTDLAPRRRDIAMVFQSYALYPHMSVRQNIGYGLKVRRTPKDEARRRVEEVAELLGLEELLERKPAQLSGGQRQRVAMGRAIVREPKAFLMDEPLSNLDAKLRVEHARVARAAARAARRDDRLRHARPDRGDDARPARRGAATAGRILQVDTPQRLYEHPANLFVAAFIGTPAMNLVEARVDGDEVAFGGFRVPLDPARRPPRGHGRVVLGIRPEASRRRASRAAGRRRSTVVPRSSRSSAPMRTCSSPSTRTPVGVGGDSAGTRKRRCCRSRRALFSARVDPRRRRASASRSSSRSIPRGSTSSIPRRGATLLLGRRRRAAPRGPSWPPAAP